MQREALYVADLVESTRTIRSYLDGITRAQWDSDVDPAQYDAVEGLLEILRTANPRQ
jgi:hypothetical protein